MTALRETSFDPAAAEQFGEQVMSTLNQASIALLLSIGHQTRLFDTMATLPPATSAQIADAADLRERYVREWLGGLATGGIVDYDAATDTYSLPAERAAVLTRAAGPDNLARLAQYIPVLAEVEQDVVDCFRHGGGVPYSKFPRFHAIMAEESGQIFDAALIEGILPLAPGLTDQLRHGVALADFGCGSGHAINLMAREYPESTFTGYDFSAEAVARGRAEATDFGVTNAAFVEQDVAQPVATQRFDAITAFDTIHDQAHPAAVLANIYTALKPGGVFLMVDMKASSHVEDNKALPWASFLYTVSTMHCMTVSLALDGDGLGTVWGEQLALRMLADAGFADVQIADVESDPFNTYYIARKSD
ncbi:class I SAM-dependent methyltransferase [Aldersonia kunmingensis]|uniref:class I SAM-dependent methyltransferase n=1 Tax=Aldersonia kunmingensis TaxID=408066 RepID=UPI000832CD53|nr:class I SAM-dependent methyltransferase [Aldersonia kunmingensis]